MLVDPLNWPDFAPAVDPLSVQTVAGTGCVKGTWISDKPGLAAIKAIVHDGDASYTKDFLVGWMTIKPVVATGGGDVNAADFCNKANIEDTLTAESVKLLGPYSNCWHNDPPIDPRHRINILVKGTLPLEADFSNYGLGVEPDAARRLGQVGSRGSDARRPTTTSRMRSPTGTSTTTRC